MAADRSASCGVQEHFLCRRALRLGYITSSITPCLSFPHFPSQRERGETEVHANHRKKCNYRHNTSLAGRWNLAQGRKTDLVLSLSLSLSEPRSLSLSPSLSEPTTSERVESVLYTKTLSSNHKENGHADIVPLCFKTCCRKQVFFNKKEIVLTHNKYFSPTKVRRFSL